MSRRPDLPTRPGDSLDLPDDVPTRRLDPRALTRDPVVLIVAVGALWTSVLAAGSPAMSLIACWLWLTVFFTIRRAVRRERLTRPG